MSKKDDEKEIPALPPGALEDMAAAIESRARGPANDVAPPAVKASEAVCPNCFFCHEMRPRYLQCRRFPPVPLFYGFQGDPLRPDAPPQPVINAVFPQMAPNSTCGEFRHRDPKKAA